MGNYLCTPCAEKEQATWPEGHVATFHTGKCCICSEEKYISCLSDWNWPKDRRFKDEHLGREI